MPFSNGPRFAHIFEIVFFILWFGSAILNIINPRLLWSITQGWKAYRDPSPAYFMMIRVSAFIMLVAGIGFLIVIHGTHLP